MRIFDELEIPSNRVDPTRYPRPIVSTLDTWDQSTQVDFHHNAAMPGKRAGWNIPSIAVTSESVNTIRSSAATRMASPSIPTIAGMHPDPVLVPPVTGVHPFVVVPNMAQSLFVDSPVHITFFISFLTVTVPDTVKFAIFRDAAQVSQIYVGSTISVANPVTVSGAYTDIKAVQGRHLYDLRWAAGVSRVLAYGKNRTFQVSNLRAQ